MSETRPLLGDGVTFATSMSTFAKVIDKPNRDLIFEWGNGVLSFANGLQLIDAWQPSLPRGGTPTWVVRIDQREWIVMPTEVLAMCVAWDQHAEPIDDLGAPFALVSACRVRGLRLRAIEAGLVSGRVQEGVWGRSKGDTVSRISSPSRPVQTPSSGEAWEDARDQALAGDPEPDPAVES